MRIDLVPSMLEAGASNEPAGTHTSRTMMFGELEALVDGCARDASYGDYSKAILEDNALAKATLATRQKSLRHLRELYALRSSVPVFAAMRVLWWEESRSRPLLALLCAATRDPLVRCSAGLVGESGVGTHVDATQFATAVEAAFPHRFSPGVRSRIGRNLASTWTQSGHLVAAGRSAPKLRVRIQAPTMVGVYALYLGHLAGLAGLTLFASPWAGMIDADPATMRGFAEEGARRGWLEFAASGGMIEVGFHHLDALVRAKGF